MWLQSLVLQRNRYCPSFVGSTPFEWDGENVTTRIQSP